MTHAMLFTGVDVVDGDGAPLAGREHLGRRAGKKGFFTMNDTGSTSTSSRLPPARVACRPSCRPRSTQEPIVLPAWDPMGALAR